MKLEAFGRLQKAYGMTSNIIILEKVKQYVLRFDGEVDKLGTRSYG